MSKRKQDDQAVPKAPEFRKAMKIPKLRRKVSEFAEVYGVAIFRMCYLWTYNDGSDGDWPPVRHVFSSTNGEWRAVFQPTIESDAAALIFTRADRKRITKGMYTADMEFVNDLVVKSFTDVLKQTGNKWFRSFDNEKETLVNVLNLTQPLSLSEDGKSLKMSFQFAGASTGDMQHYWYPLRLGEWLNVKERFESEEIPSLPFAHLMRIDYEEMWAWMSGIESFCTDLQ